jgi:hypothetical protein
MLQPSFRIHKDGLENTNFEETRLYIDAGQSHFAFAILDISRQQFIACEFYQLKPVTKEKDLDWIMENNALLTKKFQDTWVAFNTKESLLLPGNLFSKENGDSMLSMIHGDLPPGIVLHEKIPGIDMYNIYRVPGFLHDTFSRHFSTGHYWHFYSALIQVFEKRKAMLPVSFLYVIFYPSQVVVSVINEGVCHLLQTFPYDIPEDVTYHLLNITEQFELDNTEIPIFIAGLIDTGSVLYAEILKYFLLVEMDNVTGIWKQDAGFDNYPTHFFIPLFSMALCE